MSGNMVIIHGGGPTAVINASLYGAVEEAKKHPEVGKIYAAIGGTGGLLHKKLLDLREIPQEELDLLLTSPASAIGTSRDHLEPEDYAAMVPVFEEFGIRYVLLNGGNGTMDTCSRIYEQCCAHGISVMGIPKTMDNDIAVTDHSPGVGSAARYMAVSTAEVCADVRGLPIHIVVIEALGRNAGWVTASSALAADCGVGGPDLIYLPERACDEAAFLRDVQELIDRKGCAMRTANRSWNRYFRWDARSILGMSAPILPTSSPKSWDIKRAAKNPDCLDVLRLPCNPPVTGKRRCWRENSPQKLWYVGRAERWSDSGGSRGSLTGSSR